MCGQVRDSVNAPAVQSAARGAALQFGGLGGSNEAERGAAAAFWWPKHFVKFVHHEFLLRNHLGEAGHLQGLISPDSLVLLPDPQGDCAIFTELVCAFLGVLGVPWEMVTVAVNPSEPDIFSHVYAYAVMPDGSRLPIDASHGKYPGWQVPSSDVTRRQVWDSSGNPVQDRGSRFNGLHNYYLRGMGTDGETSGDVPVGGDVQEGGSYVPPGYNPTQVFGSDVGLPPATSDWGSAPGNYGGVPGYTAPSQSSAAWAGFAAQLAKAGMTLAEINAIQPGTVVSANGAILRQSPGYAVPVGSPVLSSLGGGNTILYLGGALALLLVVGMMGKK